MSNDELKELLAAAKEALTWLSGDRCCNCCPAVEDEPCEPGCVAGKLRRAIANAEPQGPKVTKEDVDMLGQNPFKSH